MDRGGPWQRWLTMVGYYLVYVACFVGAIYFDDIRERMLIEHPLLAAFGLGFLVVTSVALLGQALLALGYMLAVGLAFLFGGSKPGHVAR